MAHACPECRTENADGATFCRACGVPLAAQSAELPEDDSAQALRCEDCGHRNAAASAYCERCGYGLVALLSLGDAAPAAAPPTPAPAAAPSASQQQPSSPPLPAAWRSAGATDEDTFDPLSAPTLVMSHTAPAPLPALELSESVGVRRRPLRWVAAGLGLLAAFALLAWLAGPATPPPAMQPVPAPVAAPASVAPRIAATASAPASAAAAAVLAPVAVSPVVASAPALAPVPSAPAPAVAASATPARKRLPEPVARKRALESPAVPAEPPAPVPVAAAPAPAPPERAKTVAELCSAANLLTRGFCEQRECRRAELSADPACLKLKDAEQRRLFQQ